VALGRSIWLLPNLYSEEIPITQILTPWVEETKPKGAAQPPSLAARLAVALTVALTCVGLYRTVPEGTGVVSSMSSVNKGVLEMLNLHEGAAKSIGPGGNATGLVGSPTVVTSAEQAAAAAAIKAGRAGPAGVPAQPVELTPEQIELLAPIPEDEEAAAEGGEGAEGEAGQAAAGGEAAGAEEAGVEETAAAAEAAAAAESAAEL